MGSNTINIRQLILQHRGQVRNIDKHIMLFDAKRAKVGAIFLTFNMNVDVDELSNLLEGLEVSSTSDNR